MDLLYMLKQRGIDIFVKKWAMDDVADNIIAYIENIKGSSISSGSDEC
jgi:hypothetical protein